MVVKVKKANSEKLCPILNSKLMTQNIEDVPIIIQFKEINKNVINRINSMAFDLKSELPLIDGYSGSMSTEIIYDLSLSPEVEYISFDHHVFVQLDISTSTMEAYFPHDRGYKGEGITVAVIDTGTSPHDDLIKPINRIIDFKDFIFGKKVPYDDNGHGTHVAGIIAGNGNSSNGRYKGVAPKANILSIKALDENGGGSTSKIIEAISYIIETKDKYNTRIINLSLGTPATSKCKNDPLCKAVKKAADSGLIVVTAAGNSGPKIGTILSPGISEDVITVGAVDDKRTVAIDDDSIAKFSSRGPTNEGINKPDLVAPGVNIRSLSNTKLDSYTSLSGTSMATPLVSGSIALLLNKYNNLDSKEVKKMLMNSCYDLKDELENQGAGILNLRLLFKEDIEVNDNTIETPLLKDDLMENLLMLFIVWILLDSRI